MTEEEKSLLRNFREMGSMSQAQALEYHFLMNKEMDVEDFSEPEVVVVAKAGVAKPKRGKK